MAATRVYILAKELGVKSSAIVKKCQDEELDVKNHMSTISAGLAATIREWFSDGDNVTTIETSEKVNLEKVRVRKKPKRKATAKKAETETDDKPSTVEAPAKATAVAESPDIAAEAVVEEPLIEAEPEPEPIIPAGPMLEKPEPARLNGPQVIRVEEPEPEVIIEEVADPTPTLSEAPSPAPIKSQSTRKLIPLKDAINRIPASLRQDMEELLRADFREVRPWDSEKSPKGN